MGSAGVGGGVVVTGEGFLDLVNNSRHDCGCVYCEMKMCCYGYNMKLLIACSSGEVV